MTEGGVKHLRLAGRDSTHRYIYPRDFGGSEFKRVPRDRATHATKLKGDLTSAWSEAAQSGLLLSDHVQLTYLLRPDAGELVTRLEKSKSGIRLLSVSHEVGQLRAVILVPTDKRQILEGVLERYATKETGKGRPKNEDLVTNIDAIRLATVGDLWTDKRPFPDPLQNCWWEVWLHTDGATPAQDVWSQFTTQADAAAIRTKPRYMTFPDRVVGLAWGSASLWAAHPALLLEVAELRAGKELATPYISASQPFQAQLTAELLDRIGAPDISAPSVCVLDHGVAWQHPLVRLATSAQDVQTFDSAWSSADITEHQHGTGMAGIALYGSNFAELFRSADNIQLEHRLESVKVLPDRGENEPDAYGLITQGAAALAEVAAPGRNRVYCLAVTSDDGDGGLPTSWAASIDQLARGGPLSGGPKLLVVAVGNLREHITRPDFTYPLTSGENVGVEDPAQAWNALSVGAITDRVMIQDPTFARYEPLASSGDLSPTSRTSLGWPKEQRDEWALKPDIVMEGGNWARDSTGNNDTPDDLGLLTVALKPNSLFNVTRDTSPAAAAAARLGALILARYPDYWPETVRGLIVHSARWTDAMLQRYPGRPKSEVIQRVRCYGYGRPDTNRALESAAKQATMVFQGQLSPYRKDGNEIKTNEMHLHDLPWPSQVFSALGEERIEMRVTLSYFIEPSPGRRGWTRKHRYASHGLRFDLQRPGEGDDAFHRRMSKFEHDEELGSSKSDGGALPWVVGVSGRTKGSIHSDLWSGSAADLAGCKKLAVVPVTGWWRELRHQKAWDRKARYSLIVSIESASTDVYSLIANELAISINGS